MYHLKLLLLSKELTKICIFTEMQIYRACASLKLINRIKKLLYFVVTVKYIQTRRIFSKFCSFVFTHCENISGNSCIIEG